MIAIRAEWVIMEVNIIIIRASSTMQKKSLDAITGVSEYSSKIFKKSGELTVQCKKIPIAQVSNLHRQSGVKQKYNAIEDKLQSILKMLRNFTDTEKPVFNNAIDLATQILEETKLQVDIQFRKAQQQKNTLKVAKKQQHVQQLRPQDKFPDIKAYQNFDEHSHQNYLEDGLIPEIKVCQQVQQPSDINSEYVYIDTIDKLDNAIKQIKQHSQIAVDVEHSAKSYEGFTCLIQISTRAKDYIIDVFPIWSCVPALQEVIGNPNILKVMHGAEMDTKWLQRDFNIHIINLFDTHKASRVLGMAKFSYAHLLHTYCGVSTNKIYQRADWRERPLNLEMLKYARYDTHYLLTIYDRMRQDLLKQAKTMNLAIRDILHDIQKSSHEVTLSNAELFSYKTKQTYVILEAQFANKKEEFQAIEAIFSEINLVALKHDENFDDLICKNDLHAAISFVKDLTFNQRQKLSKEARIQKVIGALLKQGLPSLTEAISNIKTVLLNVFCGRSLPISPVQFPKTVKKPQKQKQNKSEMDQSSEPITLFERTPSAMTKFHELFQTSFGVRHLIEGSSGSTRKPKIEFKTINSFLSSKYNIEQKAEGDDHVIDEEESEEEAEEQVGEDDGRQQEINQDGRIEFKRMNPNVIYTIEAPEPEVENAINSQKPRKMKKETEYESRLRNKTGNIYDLLGTS